jgi:transposase
VGYDAGKKVKGRKRHAVVDTLGLMLGVAVLPADIQDRDGCLPVLKQVRRLFPFLQRVIADGAYQGAVTASAVRRAAGAPLQIVKRLDAAKGFVVLPKRWIVERTFGWLNRCRRLAKDVEHRIRTHLAFVQIAMIRIMLRRIARHSAQ